MLSLLVVSISSLAECLAKAVPALLMLRFVCCCLFLLIWFWFAVFETNSSPPPPRPPVSFLLLIKYSNKHNLGYKDSSSTVHQGGVSSLPDLCGDQTH